MTSYSYALLRLKKFNELILNNRVLCDKFVLGEYNFLQIYQAPIFNDFKFSYEQKSANYHLSPRGKFNFKSAIKRAASVLISVWGYAFLMLSRRRVLVYASDKISDSKYRCDFRMTNLYQQLFLKKTRFVEALHTAYDENFYKYAALRRRPALYLESADFFYKIFNKFNFKKREESINTIDSSSFGEEAEFVRVLLHKYIAMIAKTRFRINFISKSLKLLGIKILICVPDTRNYHELVQGCRLNKIKIYAFQSGALCKYDVGLLDSFGYKNNIIKPDKFLLSSQYWIDEFLRLGAIFNKEELEVGGDIKEDRSDTGQNAMQSKGRSKITTVLVPYETQALKAEVKEYIQKMLKCPDTRVIFSIRPGRDVEAQFAEYGLEDMPENFSATDDLSKVMSDIDLVAGTQSTLLYDLVGYFKLAVILKTEMDMFEGMVFNGLADELDINESNFCGRLRAVKETTSEIIAQRKAKLYEGAVSLNETLDNIL